MAIEVVVPGQIPAQKKMGGKCAWYGIAELKADSDKVCE